MNIQSSPAALPLESRASWLARAWSGLSGDTRFALRMLVKNKGFAVTALLTLALCIGANTAIFSMLYALVIKPLPYQEPERIVEVYNTFAKVGLNKAPSNITQYLDFKQHAPAFSHLALWQPFEATFGEEGEPTRTKGVTATAEIFDVLGVHPILGRFFTADNHVPAASKVVVLTQSFWTTHYQSDPGVIGRTLRLDGETFEIIGVAPHDLEAFDARARFIRPMAWPADKVAQFPRYGVSPRLYGRLKPGATLAEAQTQVAGLEQQYYDAAPPPVREFLDRSGHVIGTDTVQTQRVEPVKTSLYMLQGGVLFVLFDRLPQRRESPARPVQCAARRTRHSGGARRGARCDRAPVDHRKHAADVARGRSRAGPRLGGSEREQSVHRPTHADDAAVHN